MQHFLLFILIAFGMPSHILYAEYRAYELQIINKADRTQQTAPASPSSPNEVAQMQPITPEVAQLPATAESQNKSQTQAALSQTALSQTAQTQAALSQATGSGQNGTVSVGNNRSTRTVLSTLDPDQYRGYYYVRPDEEVIMLNSWMCRGRTDQFTPICPNPKKQFDPTTIRTPAGQEQPLVPTR